MLWKSVHLFVMHASPHLLILTLYLLSYQIKILWNEICVYSKIINARSEISQIKSILRPEASRPFGEKQFQKSIDNLAVCPPKPEVFILITIHLRR